ncbi:MAG: hypothetical protein ABJF23_18190 [Bryobacteraceae bacterium]
MCLRFQCLQDAVRSFATFAYVQTDEAQGRTRVEGDHQEKAVGNKLNQDVRFLACREGEFVLLVTFRDAGRYESQAVDD